MYDALNRGGRKRGDLSAIIHSPSFTCIFMLFLALFNIFFSPLYVYLIPGFVSS